MIRIRARAIGVFIQCRRQSTTNVAKKGQAPERVRWFYATDIPLSKPSYFNYVPPKQASKYIPFSHQDSKRLEEAFAKQDPKVAVKEDGLFEVDVAKRELGPVYWPGPIYSVRRGTWFYSNGLPCAEDLAGEVEGIYKRLGGAHDTKTCTEHKHDESQTYELESLRGRIKFASDLHTAYLSSDDSSTMNRLANFGGTKLHRGYKKEEDSEEEGQFFSAIGTKLENIMDPKTREKNTQKSMEAQIKFDYHSQRGDTQDREIDHLVLCVHGIGQKLSQKIESVNFVHDINVFRKLLRDVYDKREALQSKLTPLPTDKVKNQPKNNRVQVLPVLWRHDIQFDMTREEVDDEKKVTLEDITIDGIMALRSIVGDVILDVLLYHQPHYKKQINEAVTYQLNNIVREFTRRHGKQPKISLVGHSLGSAIVHDILAKQVVQEPGDKPSSSALEFQVDKYFALGSPLGLFRLLENNKIHRNKVCSAMYNVFHPCDPVAYRVEPLINVRAAQLPAATVPYVQGGLKTQLEELSEFGQKITESANSIWANMRIPWMQQTTSGEKVKDLMSSAVASASPTSTSTSSNSVSQENKDVPDQLRKEVEQLLSEVNPTGRVDYVLQEGVLDISLIAAIASHMSYFENEDVASFVLDSLYS